MPQAFSNMMTPVLALVVWTLVILVWLYARRIPAMRKAGIDPKMIKGSESYASLPPMNPKAVWVADNYNHLHEQPTVFYAVAIVLAIIGEGDGINAQIAWVVWVEDGDAVSELFVGPFRDAPNNGLPDGAQQVGAGAGVDHVLHELAYVEVEGDEIVCTFDRTAGQFVAHGQASAAALDILAPGFGG